MRNGILILVLAAAMTLPLEAQRGGGMGGGFRGGFGGGFHGITGVRTGLPSRGAPIRTGGSRVIVRTFPGQFGFGFNHGFGQFGGPSRFCFNGTTLCRGQFRHHHFRHAFLGWGFDGGWGYGAYWPDYTDNGYMSYDYASASEQRRLAAEIDDLERQLRDERLRRMEEEQDRESQAEQQRPAPPPKATTVPQPTKPTVLVFRDQRRAEIQNYAIVDNTLWDLGPQQQTRKILLSELDVPATIRANEDRGVEFRVPGKR